MTFLQLWDDKLDIELASADTTQLFKTVLRKSAVNEAQDMFARDTGCTRRYANVPISDGVSEYDLESHITDFVRVTAPPSIKIVNGSTTSYIQGPRDFPRHDPEELDRIDPGWRAAPASTPSSWGIREDGGSTFLVVAPAPDVVSPKVWTLIVPYVADPPDMSANDDVPFTLGAGVVSRLIPWHQALVHYAAGLLEPLRKNYSGAKRQMEIYAGIVTQYMQQRGQDGPDQITLMRNYLGESVRSQRALDPRRWP